MTMQYFDKLEVILNNTIQCATLYTFSWQQILWQRLTWLSKNGKKTSKNNILETKLIPNWTRNKFFNGKFL